MAYENFINALRDSKTSEHKAMLMHVKGLVDVSRGEMAKNYSKWDSYDMVFRSMRLPDKEDEAAVRKGDPKKMIVPLTFAQIMAFVSFNVMSITQNARFFELEPTGKEDDPLAEPCELILERDLRKNTWQAFLVQLFLDVGRFGLGAAEICWKEEYRYVKVQQDVPVEGPFGVTSTEQKSVLTPLPAFVGNRVFPVSPYRFFPDTRLPLTRYQEGEFCGSEDLFSMASLKSMSDLLFNLDMIPKFTGEEYKTRRSNSRVDLGPIGEKNVNLYGFGSSGGTNSPSMFVKSGPVVIDKVVFDLVPANFSEDHPTVESFGDEQVPIRYICWYANDKTIVRFEEASYMHCMFPYVCGQYLPDQHETVNPSLADVCDQITDLITWKINAHMASQKNSVLSKWIVDPAGIDKMSLESRSPYIYLKRNVSQTGVDRYIKQFQTQDVTANVMQDVAALKELLEGITGFSAQMQGQYSTGRRSATQDRVVAQGAGARGKTILGGLWDTLFEPMGKQLLANNRQEMDQETFARVVGSNTYGQNPQTGQPYNAQDLFPLFKSDPVGIASSEDFFVFDGTQPSEKAFLAQSLQEVLMTILQNPEVAMVLGYGPPQIQELFNQVYILRGVTPARLPTPQVRPPIMALPNPAPSPAPSASTTTP